MLHALRVGMVSYLTKGGTVKGPEEAIRRTASGGMHMTQAMAELLIRSLGDLTDRLLHRQLGNRELNILLRLPRDDLLTVIAYDLCINKKTVNTYEARILERMNLPNGVALVRYIPSHGLT